MVKPSYYLFIYIFKILKNFTFTISNSMSETTVREVPDPSEIPNNFEIVTFTQVLWEIFLHKLEINS